MPRPAFDTKARILAWDIIKREGFTALPIEPRRIMARHGIKLLDYTEFAILCGRDRAGVIEDYDEDGFLFPLESQGGRMTYCIVYNEEKDEERINWTLMHELCHYFLGHVKCVEDVMTRASKNKSELDVEADALCARLFCPTVVLHMCHVQSPEEIAELCGISYRAAFLRWQHLEKARHYKRFLEMKEERGILEQFGPFICRYLCTRPK